MKRRDFIALAGAAAAFPRVGLAQQRDKLPRIVFIAVTMTSETAAAFQAGLGDFGYIDEKTISVQLVTAPTYADLAPLVPAAVASNPDLILTWGITAAGYARQYTSTIPIVFVGTAGDPLDSGLIASWAHPGGNVTGNTSLSPDLIGKQMGILKEMIPSARRVAMLNVPGVAVTQANINQATPIARSIGLDPVVIDFADSVDLSSQFQRVVAVAPDEVYVPNSSYFIQYADALFDLLVKNRLPAISSSYRRGGSTPIVGVVSYSADGLGVNRRSGYYVDAVLKGAKPGDLPVEQPTSFDFAVNLDAAKKIGVTIPASILAQATLVIDYDIRAPKAAN